MDERAMPIQHPELVGAAAVGYSGPALDPALRDPHALTILSNEHWSLMSARALVYNEAFARAGMFLAFLSATLVALGLIATATGFSAAFLSVAAVVLALNLFVGVASLARILGASAEDIRYLQGMNRLRHAYHEMVPGLERYFITSKHDDVVSVLSFYGPSTANALRGIVHGLTTTPGMLGVISSAVTGALAAVIAVLVSPSAAAAATAGIAGFVAMFVILNIFVVFQVRNSMRGLVALFPRTDWDDD